MDAMRTPAEPVVLRHILSHPEDGAAEIERHTGVRLDTADRVIKRLRADPNLAPLRGGDDHAVRLLRRLSSQMGRIERREALLHLPEPAQWLHHYDGTFLVGGELAAAEADKIPIRPARILAYVYDLDRATKAALRLFAEFTSRQDANLILRTADPWLRPDDRHPRFVERGQRLLDADENPAIQLAAGFRRPV